MDKNDIQKLTQLARITLSDEEQEGLRGDMETILKYVSEIQNVSSGEGASSVEVLENVTREDTDAHESGLHTEVLLNEVPQREKNYVKVKKIL